MKLSKINYFIGRNLEDRKFRLMNFNYKLFKRVPNCTYLPLDLKRSGEPINTIFDIGAHVGQTCLSLTRAFPKAKIYSFEPVPATYQQLLVNTKKFPAITCINSAIGDKEEQLQIVSHDNTEHNSLNDIASQNATGGIPISVITGADFCKENNITHIDLLKIDVEGFEMRVLEGFEKSFLKDNVKFVYAETSFAPGDKYKTNYNVLEKYLTDLGYVLSGFYEQYVWGKNNLRFGFCNVLFTNSSIL